MRQRIVRVHFHRLLEVFQAFRKILPSPLVQVVPALEVGFVGFGVDGAPPLEVGVVSFQITGAVLATFKVIKLS